jgi:hypothetical protein
MMNSLRATVVCIWMPSVSSSVEDGRKRRKLNFDRVHWMSDREMCFQDVEASWSIGKWSRLLNFDEESSRDCSRWVQQVSSWLAIVGSKLIGSWRIWGKCKVVRSLLSQWRTWMKFQSCGRSTLAVSTFNFISETKIQAEIGDFPHKGSSTKCRIELFKHTQYVLDKHIFCWITSVYVLINSIHQIQIPRLLGGGRRHNKSSVLWNRVTRWRKNTWKIHWAKFKAMRVARRRKVCESYMMPSEEVPISSTSFQLLPESSSHPTS